MTPLRILYHHRTKATDGQRVHIQEIQKALRQLGHEVREVAPVAATESAGTPPKAGLKRTVITAVSHHAPPAVLEPLQWGHNFADYSALCRVIRRFRPHFIYERYALNMLSGVWAAHRFGVPLLVEVNSPLAEEQRSLGKTAFPSVGQHLENYTLGHATRVLAVTGRLKEILVERSRLDPERVMVVPNGVAAERFEQAGRERNRVRSRLGIDDSIVLGTVAFFLDWHGIDSLVRVAASAELRDRVRVLLVGEGPALPGILRLARDQGFADRVVATGAVPHDIIASYIAAIDVAVMPKAVEYASPLKLFEFMAAGLAIVAPRQQNMVEVLVEEENALLFRPGATEQLHAAVGRLVRDADLRRELGEAARATIDKRQFTWSGNAGRIVQTYVSAIAERP